MEKAREFQKKISFSFINYAQTFDSVDHNKLWKILEEMEIIDDLTCLLRNLFAGQEATVRTGHGTTDWFQIGKGVRQGCILSPCLVNFYAWKIPWMEEPGRLHVVAKSQARLTSLSLFTFMHWRRKWQRTPVFLLGKSQEERSLVGCHLWGRTELDTAEAT